MNRLAKPVMALLLSASGVTLLPLHALADTTDANGSTSIPWKFQGFYTCFNDRNPEYKWACSNQLSKKKTFEKFGEMAWTTEGCQNYGAAFPIVRDKSSIPEAKLVDNETSQIIYKRTAICAYTDTRMPPEGLDPKSPKAIMVRKKDGYMDYYWPVYSVDIE